MIEIPKGTSKGHWFRGTVSGCPVICLWCPGCGALGELSATHEIADDGTVSPSVECDCGFHEHIFLEGFVSDEDGE